MTTDFRDRLAQALWEARVAGRCLTKAELPPAALSSAHARSIAAELYSLMQVRGAQQVGLKLGATDRQTQLRLGAEQPFVAPVYDSTVLPNRSHVRLDGLVEPRLELEVALRMHNGRVSALGCIEIADSRFPAWDVSLSEAIADFGLQGLIMFGEPRNDLGTVSVVLHHDGREVGRSSRPVDRAVNALAHLGRNDHSFLARNSAILATGSMSTPIRLLPGTWTADFGELGVLELEVAASG